MILNSSQSISFLSNDLFGEGDSNLGSLPKKQKAGDWREVPLNQIYEQDSET
jgi:hypothetical protein